MISAVSVVGICVKKMLVIETDGDTVSVNTGLDGILQAIMEKIHMPALHTLYALPLSTSFVSITQFSFGPVDQISTLIVRSRLIAVIPRSDNSGLARFLPRWLIDTIHWLDPGPPSVS